MRMFSTHIVVSGRPAGVELGVQLSLLTSQVVVLGLLFAGQRVPLFRGKTTQHQELAKLDGLSETRIYCSSAQNRSERKGEKPAG